MLRSIPAAASLLAAFAILVLVGGCSEDESHLKELARYTPENLSQELLQRHKASLKRPPVNAKSKAAAKSGRDPDDGGKEQAAAAKYGEEFGERAAEGGAKGMTIDELAANVARKARMIEGLSPAEVLSKLSASVEADGDLPASEKERLKAALGKALAP